MLNLRSGPSGRPNGDIVNLGSQFSYWFIDQARLNILPVTFSKFPPTGLSSLLSKLVSYHIFVIILICKAKNHVTEAGVNIGGGAKKVSHDLVISVFKGIVDLLQVALESFTLNGVACTLAELSLWLLLNVSVLVSSTSVASFPQLGEYYSSCFLQTQVVIYLYILFRLPSVNSCAGPCCRTPN